MKRIDPIKYLPKHFTEDDKIEYQLLCDEARRIFKDIKHDFIIENCVLHYIIEKKGLTKKATEEEINQIMSNYDLSNQTEYQTPYDPDFDFESCMKPIIKPNEDTQIAIEE